MCLMKHIFFLPLHALFILSWKYRSVNNNINNIKPHTGATARDAISLNISLEYALQSTFRREAAINSIKYIGNNELAGVVPSTELLINAANISELICNRLSGDNAGVLNAVSYLSGCYKRILQRESSASEKVRDELKNCKSQIISFLASCLETPEMFDSLSKNSVSDLALCVAEDVGQHVLILLKDLMEEMDEDVLSTVAQQITDICIAKLDQTTTEAALNGHMTRPHRSILNDHELPLTVLLAFVRAHKRAAKAIASQSCFLLVEPPMPPLPTLPSYMQGLLQDPQYIHANGRQGAALEHKTLLGRLLRLSTDPRDPKVVAYLKDSYKMPQNILEGNINNLRKRGDRAQSVVTEMLLTMLKSGKEGKEAAMSLLFQTVELNTEAEKDRPSPLLGATAGFMINLGAVLLQLVRPVMTSDKVKKVDMAYVTSPEGLRLFPSDCTKLMVSSSSSSGSSSSGSSSSSSGSSSSSSDSSSSVPSSSSTQTPLPPKAPFSFISQSFFLCWRALHLGLVTQANKYISILRNLSHYHDGLASGEPHAVHYLCLKLSTDAHLLSPELLRDVIQFCAAAASSLLDALCEDDPSREKQQWLVNEDELSSKQRFIFVNLPEHILDDIMSLLLFVAKTSSTILRSSALDSVLSLIVFLLRRPSAIQSPHLRAKFGQVCTIVVHHYKPLYIIIHYSIPARCSSMCSCLWISDRTKSDGVTPPLSTARIR